MFKKLAVVAVLAIFAASFASADDSAEVSAETGAQKTSIPQKHSFVFQDNAFKYGFSNSWRVPFQGIATNNYVHTGKAYNIPGNLLEFTHIDIGNKFGDNTFNVAFLAYNHSDPISPAYFANNTSSGGHSAYFTYRHNFVLSRLTGKNFSWGPIQDVLITTGADIGTNNDAWGNHRMSPFIGPGLAFKVPNHGYLNISAMWYREWNNEGTDVTAYAYINGVPKPIEYGKKVLYDPNYTIQAAWGLPFRVGSVPFNYEGWGTFNGTKGHTMGSLLPYGAGTEYFYTKPETLIHSVLNYNFGRHIGEGHNWQIGVGYEYWNNAYGMDHHKILGCLQNAPFVQFTVHL